MFQSYEYSGEKNMSLEMAFTVHVSIIVTNPGILPKIYKFTRALQRDFISRISPRTEAKKSRLILTLR